MMMIIIRRMRTIMMTIAIIKGMIIPTGKTK